MSDPTAKTLSVAGCILKVTSRQADIFQGDTIGFDITVSGGETKVIADEISISLQECLKVHTSSGVARKYLDHHQEILAMNFTLDAGEIHSFEFTTQLPDKCRLPDGHVETGNPFTAGPDGWCLYIHVDTAEYRASFERKGVSIIKAIMNGLAKIMPGISDDDVQRLVLDRDPNKRIFLNVQPRRA